MPWGTRWNGRSRPRDARGRKGPAHGRRGLPRRSPSFPSTLGLRQFGSGGKGPWEGGGGRRDKNVKAGVSETPQIKMLRSRWTSLVAGLGAKPSVADPWWTILAAKYTEPHRCLSRTLAPSTPKLRVARCTSLVCSAYHTLTHLEEMFQYMEEYRGSLEDPNVVSAAIFFHECAWSQRRVSSRSS